MKRFLAYLSALLISVGAWSQASLVVETLPETSLGQTTQLQVVLDNKTVVKGVQADITLPDFITFNNVAPQVTARTSAFDVAYRRISERQMRIVVTSASNGKLAADSASVVKFNITVDKVAEIPDDSIRMSQASVILEGYRKVNIPDAAFRAVSAKPSFTICYVVDSLEVHRDTLMQGEAVVPPTELPTKEGYTFSGWYNLPEVMPDSSVTVMGSFTINRHLLTFVLDNDTLSSDSIAYGEVIIAPEVSLKEGYTFSGWSEYPELMPDSSVTVAGSFTVNRHPLTFVLDNDTLSSDSIAYGEGIIAPEVSLKEGYTFSGWSEYPELMPDSSVTVVGSFTVNRHLLTFVLDSDTLSSDTVAYGEVIEIPEVGTKEGYTFRGWSEHPEVMPDSSVTVVGSFTVNRHLLTFVLDNDTLSTDTVAYGEVIIAPEVSLKEGYTFSGWSEYPELMPDSSVTVVGSFTVNRHLLTFVVDNDTLSSDSIAYGEVITVPEVSSKEGYTFSGWSEYPELMPDSSVTVVGSFTVNRHPLTFVLDNDTLSSDTAAYGEVIIAPEVGIKEGYTFSGWSDYPEQMPDSSVTVVGSFTINRHLLTFVLDNDTLSTDSIAYGEVITVPEVNSKEGYTFSGWSEYPELMPDSSVTVVGTFILNEEQTDGQGLVYRLNETKDAFAVSGYTDGLISDVVVPETLYELPVNAIMDKALADATVLETITIPGSVVSVGESAFSGCSNLLVMEWNTTAPWNASCFDNPEACGNMLLFTNHADGDFGGNVVVNGVAEEITLTDGQPFRNPREFVAKSISYSREFTKKTKVGESGGWEGIILPFDVQTIVSEEKGELAPFGVADFNTTLPMWLAEMQTGAEFSLVEKITANTPFIMEVPNSDEYEERFNIEGTVTFSAEDVTVKSTQTNASSTGTNGFILQGSYEGELATPYVYALNDEEYTATDGNTFMPGGAFVADTRDVRPFEAYVYSAQMTRSRYLSIDTRGNATGIPVLMLKDDSSLVDVYTLQGIKIRSQIPVGTLEDALPAGLYIVGGRKVVIKK